MATGQSLASKGVLTGPITRGDRDRGGGDSVAGTSIGEKPRPYIAVTLSSARDDPRTIKVKRIEEG